MSVATTQRVGRASRPESSGASVNGSVNYKSLPSVSGPDRKAFQSVQDAYVGLRKATDAAIAENRWTACRMVGDLFTTRSNAGVKHTQESLAAALSSKLEVVSRHMIQALVAGLKHAHKHGWTVSGPKAGLGADDLDLAIQDFLDAINGNGARRTKERASLVDAANGVEGNKPPREPLTPAMVAKGLVEALLAVRRKAPKNMTEQAWLVACGDAWHNRTGDNGETPEPVGEAVPLDVDSSVIENATKATTGLRSVASPGFRVG